MRLGLLTTEQLFWHLHTSLRNNLNFKKHTNMISQCFRVSQHYFSQHYYKAYLEFNLDNRFAIVESLSLSTIAKKKKKNP